MPDKVPFRVRVTLWVVPGEEAGFAQFEDRALRVMRAHGMRDLRVITPDSRDGTGPHEIHEMTFPSRRAFERYRADPEMRAFAALRQRSILRTELELLDAGDAPDDPA